MNRAKKKKVLCDYRELIMTVICCNFFVMFLYQTPEHKFKEIEIEIHA